MHSTPVLMVLVIGGCGGALAAVGTPPGAEQIGLIRAERGILDGEENCVDELRALAAVAGATHIGRITHQDAYYSGVSYHFPETSRPAACQGVMFVLRPEPQ